MGDTRAPQRSSSPEPGAEPPSIDDTGSRASPFTPTPPDPAAGGSVTVIEPERSSTAASTSSSESNMAGKSKPRGSSTTVKAVRYEDAQDAPPPVVVAKILKPSEGLMRSNAREASNDVASTTRSARSASGSGSAGSLKIASLRATFEKRSPDREQRDSLGSFASVKRRWTGHDKFDKGSGAGASPVEKERDQRKTLEERCALLEEEAEKIRQEYEEKLAFLIDEADQREQSFVEKFAAVDKHAHEQRSRLSGLAEDAQQQKEALEEKCAALEDEISQLRQQGSTGAAADDADDDQCLPRARTQADEEIRDLRWQLADMKRNISMSTRMDAQVTDSVVAQETGVLHHELQNWVVHNFRKAKGDAAPQELCSRLDGMGLTPGQRHQLRPMYAGFTAANKLVMYQATAACLLMDIFTEESLFGLPGELAWREPLNKALSGLETTLAPAAHNRLRAVTFEVIKQNEGIHELVMPAAKNIAERICGVLTALSEVDGNGNRLATLTSIVRRAIDLQHLFRAQRARYQFDLPSTSDVFHAAVMDNIAIDEEAPVDFSSRIVHAATWPSLIKIGDEFGDNVHFTNVVVKAKVVCS